VTATVGSMVTATVAAVAESCGSMPRSPSTVTPLTPSTRASRASASVTRLAFESRGTRTVRIAVAVESLWSGLEDAQTVAPSKIGSQFYCEEKVALEREHGEIETPEKQRGSETHEKAAEDAVEGERAEMWDAIERGERQVLLETPFVGEAADFIVVGIPDAVVFDEGDPQLTFDRKTTSILSRLFRNQRIQVWLYRYMLQSLGFAVDDLQLAILAHEQHLDPETGKQLQKAVLEESVNPEGASETLKNEPTATLHSVEYDPTAHVEDLQWALEYWREERDRAEIE